jgi:amino acid adenylation domain-containing protein
MPPDLKNETNIEKNTIPMKPTHFSQGQCIQDLFEDQVNRTPEHIAISHKGREFTYRELNNRSNQLAHYLRAVDVGPEIPVGICFERSIDLVVGILGVLKAGGAYVPLDPNYPLERLSYMVHDIQPRILLTQSHQKKSLPADHPHFICLDLAWHMIGQKSSDNPARITTAQNLAYVIYTSGTSGNPKGVLIEHKGLSNLVVTSNAILDLEPHHRFLHATSISFDAATAHLFRVLCSGATLVLEETDALTRGFESIDLLRRERITMVSLPASILANLPRVDLPDLEILTVGAEACSLELAAYWVKGRRLFNMYGPTETTICAAFSEFKAGMDCVPLGKPLPNVRVYVLDSDLQQLPVGVPGELYIGGVGVARSYHNQPDLTQKAFINNPFDADSGTKIYKTGDLVKWLPDDNLIFLGRIDGQVKISGNRIELEEVRKKLLLNPSIKDAVVIVHENDPGQPRLVAYVVFKPDMDEDTGSLRHFLRKKLPHYMMPAAFVLLNALPLTINGKIDRNKLLDPNMNGLQSIAEYVVPRTRLEKMIATVWGQVLDIEQVGLYDNFFNLGGNSIIAVQVISKLNSTLQIKLSLPAIFDADTLEEFSNVILVNLLINRGNSKTLINQERLNLTGQG